MWPLSQAAQACFGSADWPPERPVPQVSIESEVVEAAAVTAAADELERRGHTLLHPPPTELWGQTVARLKTLEGAVVGIAYAPWVHTASAADDR